MTRQTAIIWVWVFVLIAGAVGGGFAWWRQQDVTQAYEAGRALADSQKWEEVLVLDLLLLGVCQLLMLIQ